MRMGIIHSVPNVISGPLLKSF